jgi:hypothetical protein
MNEPGKHLSTDGSSGAGAGVLTHGLEGTARSKKTRALAAGLVIAAFGLATTFFLRLGRPQASLAGKARTMTIAGSATPKEATALAERICSALHRVPSERVHACCGRSGGEFLYEECVSEVVTSLKAGAASVAPAAADRCSSAMQRSLTGCDWVTPGQPLAPAECQDMIEGKLDEGSVCRSSLECTGDLHCAGASPKRTGHCTRPQAAGAPCGTHTDSLAAYTLHRNLEAERPFCTEFCSLTSHRCEAPPAAGTPCFSQVNCARGQTCIRGACSTDPPAEAGASCRGVPCNDGLRCVEGTCRAAAEPGESCKTSFECRSGGCVADGHGENRCGMMCTVSIAPPAAAASAQRGLRPSGPATRFARLCGTT